MAAQQTPTELDAQYRVLHEGAGVLVRAESAWFRAHGSEAAEYLEGQLTNAVETLEPGSGVYAALLDRKGRMQSDLRVLRRDADEYLIETEDHARPRVIAHLDKFKVASQVSFEPLEESVLVSVLGPAAAAVAATPPLAEHESVRHRCGTVEAIAIGTAAGVDLLVSGAEAEALLAALCDDGDAERVEPEAAEILRVEAGIPRFGREMNETTIPQEAGINERAISFTKGCYIGQETVARLHYKGKPNRHLRRLVLDAPVSEGAAVLAGERETGRIGTAVISPARGPLALAILRREAEPGSRVLVGETSVGATVEEL